MEVDKEKGSPGIICILEKKKGGEKWRFRLLYWKGYKAKQCEQKKTAKFQRFQTVQGRKQWFWGSKSQEANINSFGGYPNSL